MTTEATTKANSIQKNIPNTLERKSKLESCRAALVAALGHSADLPCTPKHDYLTHSAGAATLARLTSVIPAKTTATALANKVPRARYGSR